MIRNEFPALAAPSWVIPGTYAENLRFLAAKKEITGVELLFFMYDDEIKAQLDSEWKEIYGFRERFIFTAHLPENLLPGHEELAARLAPLVRHFVVHPPRENPGAQAKLLADWTRRYGGVQAGGRRGPLFLAENITPGLLEALLPHLDEGTGLCMDTGHLLMEGKSPAEFFTGRRDRIGEIHLHGIDREAALRDGRLADHRRLREDDPWLAELFPLLKDYRGLINLEVFSWEEVRAGMEVLQNMRTPVQAAPELQGPQ
ncbi:MAG: AP endonuclease [Treponema sp.]|jgi:sugar phosphate isomerase/epimerase|nr:AP endonuclease [Treponema sp.]